MITTRRISHYVLVRTQPVGANKHQLGISTEFLFAKSNGGSSVMDWVQKQEAIVTTVFGSSRYVEKGGII